MTLFKRYPSEDPNEPEFYEYKPTPPKRKNSRRLTGLLLVGLGSTAILAFGESLFGYLGFVVTVVGVVVILQTMNGGDEL
jgi:hypothetical protein